MDEPIPDTPVGFLTLLFTGAGTLFGLLTYWIVNWVIALWEARQGGTSISATKRRWISILTPITLVWIGYAGLVLAGAMEFTGQSAYLAAVSSIGAAGSKQISYAAAQSVQKPAAPDPAPPPPPIPLGPVLPRQEPPDG